FLVVTGPESECVAGADPHGRAALVGLPRLIAPRQRQRETASDVCARLREQADAGARRMRHVRDLDDRSDLQETIGRNVEARIPPRAEDLDGLESDGPPRAVGVADEQ